jgi:small-conductance mechanosensitive channel
MNIKQLHYVYDETDISKGIFNQELPITKGDWEKVRYNVIDNSSLFLNYTLPYSTFEYKLPLGDPLNLNGESLMSEFTMRYGVKYIPFSFRGVEGIVNGIVGGQEGVISIQMMLFYLLLASTLFIWVGYIRRLGILKPWVHNAIWAFRFGNVITIILCSEFLISQLIFDLKVTDWGYANLDKINNMMQGLEFTMSTILWLFPAYYLISALEHFGYNPVEERTGTEIPKILKLFVSALIYVLAFIGILAYVFEITTNSLMATSGAFAILFAVLSKVDLTNIVAGLGISFSGAIKIGEWVRIGDKEGEVIEMSARGTKLKTINNTIIDISNSDVGSAIIENLGKYPHRLHIHLEIVPTDYLIVERVLQNATYYTDGVLHTPNPFVAFLGQGDSAQIFEVYFFIENYSDKGAMVDKVWRSVWKACEDNMIKMSTPQREHYNFEVKS